MRRPTVTFILPLYNGAATLPGCLESLLRLRLQRWECIVVNDASPDDSEEVVKRVAGQDERLTLVRHEHNLGVAGARNSGLRHARGTYLHLLDQDDHLDPDGVGELCRLLDRSPDAAGAYGDYLMVDTRSGRAQPSSLPEHALTFADFSTNNYAPPIAMLAGRELVQHVGGFQAGMESCDDWDLWARMTRTGRCFLYARAMMGEYRIHHSNNTRNASRNLLSALRLADILHSADARVPDPAPEWANGVPVERKARFQLQALWSQIAMRLAERDVEGAMELVDRFIGSVGSEPITVHSARQMHGTMHFASAFAGLDPRSYFPELESILETFFCRLATRLDSPDFAHCAVRDLRASYITSLIEENSQLAQLVHNYRTSRSYRLGRFITRGIRAAFGGLLPRRR